MHNLLITLVLFTFATINLQAEESTSENLTKLYIATFDRAPDKDGSTYWLNTKMPLEDIATSFFDQAETQDKYPSGYSTIDFINAIYSNLFKRTPDQIGGDYWYKELDKNGMIKSKFILAIINGAKDDDAKILDNKTEIGLAFVNSGSNDVSMAKDVMRDITADRSTVENNLNKFGFTKEYKRVEIPQVKLVVPIVTKPTLIAKPVEETPTVKPTVKPVAPIVKPAPIAKLVVPVVTKPTPPIAKPVETPTVKPVVPVVAKPAETPTVAPVEQTPKPKEQDEKEEQDDLPTDS